MKKRKLKLLKAQGRKFWADKSNAIDASWTANLQKRNPGSCIFNPLKNYLRHYKRHEDEKRRIPIPPRKPKIVKMVDTKHNWRKLEYETIETA